MKNYLIRSLYKIKSPMWFEDRSSEGDLYDWYMKMHDISLRSFEKNLGIMSEVVKTNIPEMNIINKPYFIEVR